jgi:predicted DCC family thiol-disulfide oxidoreductase YuxK
MGEFDSGSAGGCAVVFFDGVCNLCNWFVRFVTRRDSAGKFVFAAIESGTAARLLGKVTSGDSVVLVENGRTYRNSTAVLRIAKNLHFPWPVLYVLIAVPEPLRDWAYRLVARNRYRWFGRKASCAAPEPKLRTRFLP